MSYREACEFFRRHGNVSSSVEELLKGRPLPHQLRAACDYAIRKGQDPMVVREASEAIEKG